MGEPHRPQHRDANEAKLNCNGKSLVVRIGRHFGARAGLAGCRLSEHFRYRASAVSEQRSAFDKTQRVGPEHDSFAAWRPQILGLKLLGLAPNTVDAVAQIARR